MHPCRKAGAVRRAPLALALLLAGWFVHNPGWKTPATVQRGLAQSYAPAELETPGAYHRGEPKRFRVRVYVDQDYRQRPHWRDHASNLVRRANAYLAPAFGVALDAQFIDWKRSSPGQDLDVIVGELAALDEGFDVDWVIGLVAPPATFTIRHHELGMARILGRHFVVRDMNDAQEALQIHKAFDELPEQERTQLYAARKAHKELVVFLHEWAHSLGAIHERGEGRVMGNSYDSSASTFSEANAGVIERGLALRAVVGDDARAREARAAAEAALLAFVRSTVWEEWFAEEKTQLVELLGGDAVVGGGVTGGTGAASAREQTVRMNLPKAAVAGYNRAVDELRASDYQGAWSELEPLVSAFPATPEIQKLACRLAVLGAGGDEALGGCERAARVDTVDAYPPFWQASVLARASAPDDAQVLALLAEVEARLGKKGGDVEGASWLELARFAWGYGALTLAERALAKAGPGEATRLATELLDTRRLLGLPPGGGARVGVPPEKEPAYYRAFNVAYRKFMDTEPRFARETVTAELRRFPDAPGLLALACGVDASSRKPAPARKLCQRALAGWDETVLAHFVSAQIATRPADSIAHLERVVALDPAQRGAWATLGALYEQTGAADKRRKLALEYKQRFGESLPVE